MEGAQCILLDDTDAYSGDCLWIDPLLITAAIDRALKELNLEYAAKRDSQRLAAPVLHVMREGWYERDRQRQVAEVRRIEGRAEDSDATDGAIPGSGRRRDRCT